MADKTEKPKRTRKTAMNPLIEAGKAQEQLTKLGAQITKLDARLTKLHEQYDGIRGKLSPAALELLGKVGEDD